MGNPIPDVSITKNGQKIPQSDSNRLRIFQTVHAEQGEKHLILLFSKLLLSDTGMYTCTATNDEGTTTSRSHLQVTRKQIISNKMWCCLTKRPSQNLLSSAHSRRTRAAGQSSKTARRYRGGAWKRPKSVATMALRKTLQETTPTVSNSAYVLLITQHAFPARPSQQLTNYLSSGNRPPISLCLAQLKLIDEN